MRCLWITFADPDPPHNGQYVYSSGLIRSLADAGADLVALALRRRDGRRRDGDREGNILWRLAGADPRSAWSSLPSGLPNIAHRCRTADMRRLLRELLDEGGWHAIVIDGLSAGWALGPISAWRLGDGRNTRLIYVSHNHEESLRRRVARSQTETMRRLVLQLDAAKAGRLERALVRDADAITVITAEDGELYRSRWADRPMTVLPPGFGGHPSAGRRITAQLPRRAVLVGSFDWIAKRMNLEEFVSVADPIFAAQGIELSVIGSADRRFLDRMRRRSVNTRFVGPVESIAEHMAAARAAIVPERSGGGFKLKVLDYVFARLPILALEGSVAGMPLRHDESILLYPDQEALALGVVQAIDDVERLDGLQDRAFRACAGRFDWASRGRELMAAMAA